ncbi:MAG: hypothetical protein ABJB98_07785 [Actinomycetota bacterium]
MRPSVRLRVTAVLHEPPEEVRRRVAHLDGTRAYVVGTAAGVLVTLERRWAGPIPSRRSVLRLLERQRAELMGG